jgi:hypothetical protein
VSACFDVILHVYTTVRSKDLRPKYTHIPVCAGLLGAVAEGPRATEQFAAVVAVFVAALTASARAQDISARFLEQLAKRLEQVCTVARQMTVCLCCVQLAMASAQQRAVCLWCLELAVALKDFQPGTVHATCRAKRTSHVSVGT